MIRRLTFIIATLLISWSISAKTYEVISPDGSLKTEVSVADGKVVYSVMKDGKEMISPSLIGMQLADGTSYDGSNVWRETQPTRIWFYKTRLC